MSIIDPRFDYYLNMEILQWLFFHSFSPFFGGPPPFFPISYFPVPPPNMGWGDMFFIKNIPWGAKHYFNIVKFFYRKVGSFNQFYLQAISRA